MAIGNQTPASVADEFALLQFVVQQMISQVQTLTLVRIVSCSNDGGIAPVGTVTVQPLVNLMTGGRTPIKHKPLYDLPYVRVQGGVNAIIMDPKEGDIGLAGFCSRDISAVKANKDIANPGTFEQFSMSDGIYIGGCLNGTPQQYVVFKDDGITVVSPTAITLQAPTINLKGDVVQTDGDVSMSQDLTVTGDIHSDGTITGDTDVVAGTISGKTHVHAGVTTGSGSTAPPT